MKELTRDELSILRHRIRHSIDRLCVEKKLSKDAVMKIFALKYGLRNMSFATTGQLQGLRDDLKQIEGAEHERTADEIVELWKIKNGL